MEPSLRMVVEKSRLLAGTLVKVLSQVMALRTMG